MKKITTALLLTTMFLFNSCAKIFYSPDYKERTDTHQIIAIVPPKVHITTRKNVDAEVLIEQQKSESASFQREMYSWFLKRKMQRRVRINIQDLETTNA